MSTRSRWRGPPLALQILGLMLGGLVVAQLVTLLLTVVLPPAPAAQYGLDDIAAALRGDAARARLERRVQAGPPDISGGGWLVSERSRRDLAALLGARPDAVSLAFYTPLPFAGTALTRPIAAMANDGPDAGAGLLHPAALLLLQPPGGGPPQLPLPQLPGGAAGAGRPPPSAAIPSDGFPPELLPGGAPGGPPGAGPVPRARGGRAFDIAPPPAQGSGSGLYAIDPRPFDGAGGIVIPGDRGAAVPPILRGGESTTPPPLPPGVGGPPGGAPGGPPLRPLLPDRALLAPVPALPAVRAAPLLVPPATTPPPVPPVARAPAEPRSAPAEPPPSPSTSPAPVAAAPAPEPVPAAPLPPPVGPPIPIAPASRALFGFAPAPFVEGDFVAALRLADGRWAVVQPAPEPFPNSWQRRVLLWFACAFAIVAPIGWLFARRLVTPLGRFASAAEALGRDPSSAVLPLAGPAEIGRAANAFNLMQSRLRSFVDDRTAMIGAISHDLRTPLTRMRFRIEDTDGEVRDGMLEEVDAMEAMITQVITFIRDASIPNLRERVDIVALAEDVAETARMIGHDVTVARLDPAPVEIDVLGIRRLLDNLIENAVKYGLRARLGVIREGDAAIVEIVDAGPGLPDDEVERAFEPFYRSERARASATAGSGLGLAVCRSIARAHGGDVRLFARADGFVAQLRLPLAFGAVPPAVVRV